MKCNINERVGRRGVFELESLIYTYVYETHMSDHTLNKYCLHLQRRDENLDRVRV